MDYRHIRLACCLATIAGLVALGGLACAPAEPAFEPEIPEIRDLPLGLDANMMQIPEDNPITAEKVALGWQLFYDGQLSLDGLQGERAEVLCRNMSRPLSVTTA